MKFPLWRRRRDEELEDEIRSHLEMAARDRIERGESEGGSGIRTVGGLHGGLLSRARQRGSFSSGAGEVLPER